MKAKGIKQAVILTSVLLAGSALLFLQLTRGGATYSDTLWLCVVNIQATRIAFNHDWDGHDSDALNVRANKTITIPVPEYAKGVENEPAAYVMNKSVTLLVRFTVEPAASVASMRVKGVSGDTDGSLGNVLEKVVSFEGGVSKEGVDDPATPNFDESEYVDMPLTEKTAAMVCRSQDYWNWTVTEVNVVGMPAHVADRSGPHKIYTLFDTPKSPWVLTKNNQKNPWTDVLEDACVWADTAQNEDTAMSLITTGAYHGLGKDYDGHQTHVEGSTCHLSALLAGTVVDCQDMSAIVQLYTRVLGGPNAKVRSVEGPFTTELILPISAGGSGTWTTEDFVLHQFGWKGNVYDASLMLDYYSPRVPVDENLNTTYKNDLYHSGAWNEQAESEITNFD